MTTPTPNDVICEILERFVADHNEVFDGKHPFQIPARTSRMVQEAVQAAFDKAADQPLTASWPSNSGVHQETVQ